MILLDKETQKIVIKEIRPGVPFYIEVRNALQYLKKKKLIFIYYKYKEMMPASLLGLFYLEKVKNGKDINLFVSKETFKLIDAIELCDFFNCKVIDDE